MGKLSINGKRIVVGIASLPPLFCLINYFGGLHIFGRFDEKVLIGAFVLAAVIAHFFGPTVQEIRDYRDAKRAMKGS